MKTLMGAMAAVVVLSAATLIWLEQPDWLPDALASDQRRVLVFLVGDAGGVANVRRAVSPDRVVYASDEALALVEGRIVATDAAAVSDPVNAVGWRDRPLEIFHVEQADRFRGAPSGNAGEAEPDRMARLRELVNKPTLTYGEQVFVLQAMNEGIAF